MHMKRGEKLRREGREAAVCVPCEPFMFNGALNFSETKGKKSNI